MRSFSEFSLARWVGSCSKRSIMCLRVLGGFILMCICRVGVVGKFFTLAL